MSTMFDRLFGWRKASKCKLLIKRVQCRLKLLQNKRLAIVRQLKEDISQLLKDGHDPIAFNRLEQLYMDESILSAYEVLDNLSEFIILHLSYIRRHKDIPDDINEAVSSLVFASARCGELPELRLLRKLFRERYGLRFTAAAVELHSGNLVNHQVKDKLTPQPVPEEVKNRMLDEIVRDYLFKPGPLALKYNPEFHAQEAKGNYSIVLQSPPAISETPKRQTHESIAGYSSESSTQYPEESVIYLDDVEEFKSPTKHDQRFFVFRSPTKQTVNDDYCQIYYSKRSYYRKKIEIDDKERCSLDRPCYFYTNEIQLLREKREVKNVVEEYYHVCKEDIEEMGELTSPLPQTPRRDSIDSPSMRKCGPPPPYVRASTMPHRRETKTRRREVPRSGSLQLVKVPNKEYNCVGVSVSPRYVHPKLPDYDEISAKFMELKRIYQQNKCKS